MAEKNNTIGGNDVANSFATSVGAKALTLRQVIVIASICEFSGAMLLGSKVTATIKESIVVGEYYEDNPALLMFGMCIVLVGCAFWLIVATWFELPVSSTHTCIGGMLGMAVVSRGFKAIHWSTVINVICSWFYTPLLAGIISFSLFWIIRRTVLTKDTSYTRSLALSSPLIAAVLFLNFFVLLNGGCPWFPALSYALAALCSLVLSVLIACLFRWVGLPRIRSRIEASTAAEDASIHESLLPNDASIVEVDGVSPSKPRAVDASQPSEATVSIPLSQPSGSNESNGSNSTNASNEPNTLSGPTTLNGSSGSAAREESKAGKESKLGSQDVFARLKSDATVATIHEHAEEFEPRTERMFVYLQVLAAVLNSFAHGANDVSHSMGPFAACIAIYNTGRIDDASPCPAWILALGAVGIIVGLATMGYKVMATVGVNLVRVTPCRGFFIELAASVVVIVGSRLGMPLSTTQCKIGAAVGVGFVGGKEGVNWKLFLKIFAGWVVTIFIAALVSSLLMGFVIYAPKA